MTFYTRFKLLDPTYTAILEYTCQQKLINCVGNDFKVYEVMINSFFINEIEGKIIVISEVQKEKHACRAVYTSNTSTLILKITTLHINK